ncbi:unnamed protein product, partial [marine sediment metagenome]
SLTILDLDTKYKIAVLEMGASAPGEIRRLAGIARLIQELSSMSDRRT